MFETGELICSVVAPAMFCGHAEPFTVILKTVHSTMFLNQTSHYALRAMTGLVTSTDSNPVRSRELAEQTGVPSHYLSKIMRKMVEAGYVRSRKGHGGGFVMNIRPEDLKIIDVLAASGFDIDEQPCVFGWKECRNEEPCPLHPVWKRLKNCFNDWACNTTFQEIKEENSKLDLPDIPDRQPDRA